MVAEKVLKEVKDEYKTPLAVVRGVFLCENMMVCQSPVKKVTLEEWEAVTPDVTKDFEDISFQTTWDL